MPPKAPKKPKDKSKKSVSEPLPDAEEGTDAAAGVDCICTKCKTIISDEDDSLMCERCAGWDCIKCTGLSKPVYDEMKINNCMHYFCQACQAPAMKAWKADAEIEKICNGYFKKHDERLKKVEESVQVKADKTELDVTKTKVTTLEADLAGLKKDISVLNHRINLVRFEPHEKIKRKNNVVFRGLPESEESTDENSDDLLAKHVLDEIGCSDIIPLETTRLGKKITATDTGASADSVNRNPGPGAELGQENGDGVVTPRVIARPLRVCLNSSEDKSKVLKNGKLIRHSKTNQLDPKRVFIVPDQTALEREDDKVLRTKLQAKREAHPNNTFIIRSRQIQETDPATGAIIQPQRGVQSVSKIFWSQTRR